MTGPDQYNIEPFLNPKYWGGGTLGVGETCRGTYLGNQSLDGQFGKAVLQHELRSDQIEPLHTFYDGSIFDPAKYRQGVIVLFREEVLHGEAAASHYNLDELAAQPLPTPPTETKPYFGEDVPVVVATDGKRYYSSRVHWGVVPPPGNGNYLPAVAAMGVSVRNKRVQVDSRYVFINRAAPIVVGATVHRPKTARSDEILRRVNILHVITRGITGPARHFVAP